MAAYHVFIDGAVDRTQAGTERLAQAIADHYGLSVDTLQARIASGRFRVKGNCDRATAESYVNDLARLGATCSVEEASPQNQSLTPLPFPVPSIQPPPAKPAPAGPLPNQTSSQLSARTSTAGRAANSAYQSGLSAAFAGEASAAQLGALGGDDAAFTLAAIDGSDDAPPPPSPARQAFAPPDSTAQRQTAPYSDGSGHSDATGPLDPAPHSVVGSAAHSGSAEAIDPGPQSLVGSADHADTAGAIDLFAPPEAGEAALVVDLAPDEADRVARKRKNDTDGEVPHRIDNPGSAGVRSTPGEGVRRWIEPPETAPATAAASPLGKYARPSLVEPAPAIQDRPRHPLANERVRFVLGVVVALLIGFLPAHIISSMREKSAFASVDAKVVEAQTRADSDESYAALDAFRASQLERKRDDRQGIAMMALFIWGAAGGAIGYVWFRRIPWERFG